jgi:hypothetical protein
MSGDFSNLHLERLGKQGNLMSSDIGKKQELISYL